MVNNGIMRELRKECPNCEKSNSNSIFKKTGAVFKESLSGLYLDHNYHLFVCKKCNSAMLFHKFGRTLYLEQVGKNEQELKIQWLDEDRTYTNTERVWATLYDCHTMQGEPA
jgi:hypothetical protein